MFAVLINASFSYAVTLPPRLSASLLDMQIGRIASLGSSTAWGLLQPASLSCVQIRMGKTWVYPTKCRGVCWKSKILDVLVSAVVMPLFLNQPGHTGSFKEVLI